MSVHIHLAFGDSCLFFINSEDCGYALSTQTNLSEILPVLSDSLKWLRISYGRNSLYITFQVRYHKSFTMITRTNVFSSLLSNISSHEREL